MANLANIKLLLGLEDKNDRDALLLAIVNNIENRLKVLLGKTTVPTELSFIVEEIAIVRYNRRGGEGFASESVEGHSITYNDNDFSSYLKIIDKFAEVEPVDGKWIDGEVKAF